jgi:hypothetical protein
MAHASSPVITFLRVIISWPKRTELAIGFRS